MKLNLYFFTIEFYFPTDIMGNSYIKYEIKRRKESKSDKLDIAVKALKDSKKEILNIFGDTNKLSDIITTALKQIKGE